MRKKPITFSEEKPSLVFFMEQCPFGPLYVFIDSLSRYSLLRPSNQILRV